jgi:hypothetical protein
VHEFAHVWDNNFDEQLSKGLEIYTGGITDPYTHKEILRFCDEFRTKPGCNNAGYFYGNIPSKGSEINFTRREDFAESVTAFVYPDIAEDYVAMHFRNTPLYYSDYTQTLRWSYVNGLIQGTIDAHNPLK